MSFKDYYNILGLETNKVTIDQIKSAYRKQAKKYHPDVNVGDKLAEEKIKDVNEAYRILSNPSTKRKYDRTWNYNVGRRLNHTKTSGQMAGEIFGMFFGSGDTAESIDKPNEPAIRGEDIETEINISLEEGFYGANKTIVFKDLENKGIIFIDDLKQNLEKRKTIIRAHGIAKEVYTQADKMGIDLIDLTCPKVLKIHKIVSEYNEKEYYIFLVGSKKHPEIIGTASFCGDDVSIIENIDDINISIDNFKKSNRKKLAIVVQTTFSLQKFTEITESIKKKFKNFENIEVVNTICNATKIRQEETEELSKKVDCMIIVGGKNSSNTKKLYEISKKNCNNTICVEEVNEIDKGVLKQGNIVGIMAGASTPQCSINSVIELVKNT